MERNTNLKLLIVIGAVNILFSCTGPKLATRFEVKRVDTYLGNPKVFSTSLVPINETEYYLSGFYTGFIKGDTDSISTTSYNGYLIKKTKVNLSVVNLEREILEMKSLDRYLFLNSRGQGDDIFAKVNKDLKILWQKRFKSRWPDLTDFDVNKNKALYLFNYSDSLILDNGQKFHYPFGKGKTSTIIDISQEDGTITKTITKNVNESAFTKIILCPDDSYYLIHRSIGSTIYRFSKTNELIWQKKIDGFFSDALLDKGKSIKLITVNGYYSNSRRMIDVMATRLNKNGVITFQSQLNNLEPKDFDNLKIEKDRHRFIFTCRNSINTDGSTNDFTRYNYTIKVVGVRKNGQMYFDTLDLRNVGATYFTEAYKKTIFLTVEYFDNASINGTLLESPGGLNQIASFVALLKKTNVKY
jgi:hypothetical protein